MFFKQGNLLALLKKCNQGSKGVGNLEKVVKRCAEGTHNTGDGGGGECTQNGRPTLLVPTPLQGGVEDCKISAGHLLRINPNRPSGFHEHRFTNSLFKAHRAALRCPGDSVTSRLSSRQWSQETWHCINFIYSSCSKKTLNDKCRVFVVLEIKGTSNIPAVASEPAWHHGCTWLCQYVLGPGAHCTSRYHITGAQQCMPQSSSSSDALCRSCINVPPLMHTH